MSDPDSPMAGESETGEVVVSEGAVTVWGGDQREDGEAAGPESSAAGWDLSSLCQLALEVLVGEGVTRGRLDMHLADPDTMAELKAEHFGEHRPTDVLAFPLDDHLDDDPLASDPFSGDGNHEPMLGDVVICPVVAARQASGGDGAPTAERFGAEMRLLCVHGVLHILGHDHAEAAEAAIMREREQHYLRGLRCSR